MDTSRATMIRLTGSTGARMSSESPESTGRVWTPCLWGVRPTKWRVRWHRSISGRRDYVFSRTLERSKRVVVNRRIQSMRIQYLEIVTKDVDAVCAAYSAATGAQFSEPDAGLGNARTTALAGGGLLGVRAPLRDTEDPVVRPYGLVDDIEAALAAAAEAGGTTAQP